MTGRQMKSIADQLPPEIAKQIHPDWRKNELAYWAVRDQLLSKYSNQWVAFADDAVIVNSTSPVDVLHAAQQSGRHPFVICVGKENEPDRIRRSVYAYDTSYFGEPLPVMNVEFRQARGALGMMLDKVIADTGADTSVLPWADCQSLDLSPAQGVPGFIGGVAGGRAASIAFRMWVLLDGQEYPCRLQADFAGRERILGRDVMNRLEILFRGPSGEIIVNP
jgi:hypothetical protein